MTSTTPHIPAADLAAALLRLAEVVQHMTKTYGIYAEGRAYISSTAVTFVAYGGDPAAYCDQTSRNLAWNEALARTRHDNTRGRCQALDDAIESALADGLPGDYSDGGNRYTPDQIREVAHRLTPDAA
ncbi:hypothetical protein ACFVH9_08330 [Streptomyces hirsutus]|uniref:hypothetical protein n=1 Tax=Streptomyces hirsutus TaxID=35620 RepID=UPI00362851A2